MRTYLLLLTFLAALALAAPTPSGSKYITRRDICLQLDCTDRYYPDMVAREDNGEKSDDVVVADGF
jgi:hypothetical protein